MKKTGFSTLAIAVIASLSLLACDDSSSSNNGDNTKKVSDSTGIGTGTGTGTGTGDVNGTMTLGTKSMSIDVSAIYDTSLSLSISENNGTDNEWGSLLTIKPGKGTYQISAQGMFSGIWTNEDEAACVYSTKSGSVTISAWSEAKVDSYTMATFSGSGSLVLTEFMGSGDNCPDVNVKFQFQNATAVKTSSIKFVN